MKVDDLLPGSPHGPGALFGCILGLFVVGLFIRGPRCITNWLLLIPAGMAMLGYFCDAKAYVGTGLWMILLMTVTLIAALLWALAYADSRV